VKLLPVLVILTALTVIGINGNPAFADEGNTIIFDIFPQGGVSFQVIDPDGIQSAELLSSPGRTQVINEFCDDPQVISTFFNLRPDAKNDATNTYEITDCQSPPSTSTWEIFATSAGQIFSTAVCVDNCGPPPNCNVLTSPATMQMLQADPDNCIVAGDKIFKNFRNFDLQCEEFGDVEVYGTFVGDEKGLRFEGNGCLEVEKRPSGFDTNIGVSFDYDVISQGTPIIDNTLTLDFFRIEEDQPSQNTRITVSEQVHPDLAQLDPFIAFKEVFADGALNEVLSEHKDFAPQQSISVNVDIGIQVENPQQFESASADLQQFTQTFSQAEPTQELPVGGELIPIETTSLILAGAQTFSWMIPVVLSVIGIGLFVVSRKLE